jgi:hypothetical protein
MNVTSSCRNKEFGVCSMRVAIVAAERLSHAGLIGLT